MNMNNNEKPAFLKGKGAGQLIQRDPPLPPGTAQSVFAQINGHADEPVAHMVIVLKGPGDGIELDEHFLHHVLSVRDVPKVAQGDAEDHILMLVCQPVEFRSFHIASPAV